MRQVPRYLLIGGGRVARHFQYYLTHLQIPYASWQRSEAIGRLEEQVAQATHILLLISDKAIDEFIGQHLSGTSAMLIHCSGSLISEHAFGAHPLSSFSHELFATDQYREIPFIVDHDAPEFADLLPGLPNTHVRLQKSQKAKYHALSVLSGNFSCILWQKLFSNLEAEFNIPSSIAHHYLQRVTQNLLTDAQSALTGPLVRGDRVTIEKNIAALDGDAFKDIYKSFVASYEKAEKLKAEEMV